MQTINKHRFVYILVSVVFMRLCCASSSEAQSANCLTKVHVLIDNDYCGDPDGLFQLAQQALSSTTEIVGIVGGHLSNNAGFISRTDQATESVERAKKLLDILGMSGRWKVVPGAEHGMTDTHKPIDSEGARLIISEARKCSPDKPLYVCCGAALTNVASALLLAPDISRSIVLVWIGGQEYKFGAVPPPGHSMVEYNLNLCIPAAQVVFNQSDLRLWQVPRDVYRQCLYSTAELQVHVKPFGRLGAYLYDAVDKVMKNIEHYGTPMGETYILGDSPLVLLTSLQSGFEADPCSSKWVPTHCPHIANDGSYQSNPNGRIIRVYTQVDCRLMFGDMEAKIESASNKW
ncbi:MAG: nucleoside hydrolase [Prevotella sp.]|jgi:purine nucleosidase